MSLSALIRSMAEAGAPPEAIALAVEAIEQRDAADRARKDAARDKKRLQRETKQDAEGTVPGPSRDKSGTVGGQIGTPPQDKESPPDPLRKPNPPGCELHRADAREKSLSFSAFWQAYPNKVGKLAAGKAYAKALMRITGPDPPGVILAGLEACKPGWTDLQFVPHPSTWLNQGRWMDEPPETSTVVPLRHDRPAASPSPAYQRNQENMARSFAAAQRVAERWHAERGE